MARIPAIGTATLDLVFTLTHYPDEDAELHARGLRISPGGNAANTLVVLSQLGHACAFGGVLAEGPEVAPVLTHLAGYGIDLTACRLAGCKCGQLGLEGLTTPGSCRGTEASHSMRSRS